MAESEETKFEVIFTTSARLIFYKLLDYLLNFYSFTRVEQISLELIDLALKLSHLYDREHPIKINSRVKNIDNLIKKTVRM